MSLGGGPLIALRPLHLLRIDPLQHQLQVRRCHLDFLRLARRHRERETSEATTACKNAIHRTHTFFLTALIVGGTKNCNHDGSYGYRLEMAISDAIGSVVLTSPLWAILFVERRLKDENALTPPPRPNQ